VADRAVTTTLRLWLRLPLVARIGVVYLLARVVTTVLFLIVAEFSTVASRFGPAPTLVDFVLGWDAQWYWYVAYFGYPTVLPVSETGLVEQNAWAFMPLYPAFAELVGVPLG